MVIADCRLPIVNCRLPIVNCRLSIADCQLPIVERLAATLAVCLRLTEALDQLFGYAESLGMQLALPWLRLSAEAEPSTFMVASR